MVNKKGQGRARGHDQIHERAGGAGPDKPGKVVFDWRREFGLEAFDLPAKELSPMCEEIYRARVRQLKYSTAPGAPLLLARSNEAITAARLVLDGVAVHLFRVD